MSFSSELLQELVQESGCLDVLLVMSQKFGKCSKTKREIDQHHGFRVSINSPEKRSFGV